MHSARTVRTLQGEIGDICARSFGASALMLRVKAICPASVNVPSPMLTAKVTSAVLVEMDYRRSKRRGTVQAGLPRVVVTPT